MIKVKFNDASTQAKMRRVASWYGKKPRIYNASMPSGWTCPAATDCKAWADRISGKITDGKSCQFRCFGASDEARSREARDQGWSNFDALRMLDSASMAAVIINSIPADAEIIRVHVRGDFWNQAYFDAWMDAARQFPAITFYAYTKSLNYWINGNPPRNFVLTASYGGRWDYLIEENSLKSARVVFSIAEAEDRGLEIDHDESHAILDHGDFALLLHGTQPKGSAAADARQLLISSGAAFSYSKA